MSVVLLAETTSSGVPCGTIIGQQWNLRELNTVLSNTVPWCSLNHTVHQFTLKPGTYTLDVNSTAVGAGGHKLRVRNITTGDLYYGLSSLSDSLRPSNSGNATLNTIISVSVTRNTFVLEHYAQNTSDNIGMGFPVNSGDDEIYSTIIITKM